MAKLKPLFTWRSAICESDLHRTTRHIALTLSLHMSEMGDSCFPSIARLARESGCDSRTVQRHLRTLEAEGWIERGEHIGTGGRGKYGTGVQYRAVIKTPGSVPPVSDKPPAADTETPGRESLNPRQAATLVHQEDDIKYSIGSDFDKAWAVSWKRGNKRKAERAW